MRKNSLVLEIGIVILVLGIFTIGLISTNSYAFKDSSNDYLKEIEHVIVKQATLYGATLNNLKSEGNLIITLDDLVEAGYYVADNNGNVVDPRNSKATLNGLKIKLTYVDEGNIKAEVLDEN